MKIPLYYSLETCQILNDLYTICIAYYGSFPIILSTIVPHFGRISFLLNKFFLCYDIPVHFFSRRLFPSGTDVTVVEVVVIAVVSVVFVDFGVTDEAVVEVVVVSVVFVDFGVTDETVVEVVVVAVFGVVVHPIRNRLTANKIANPNTKHFCLITLYTP